MKRCIFGLTLLCASATQAQTLNVEQGHVTYSFPAAQAGEMKFGGTTLSVTGKEFGLSESSRVYVDNSPVEDNVVRVVYEGSNATVRIAGNVARYVTADVSGAHVSIVQSDEAGDATCGEIMYALSGISSDGSLLLSGSYKSTIELEGLILTNPNGAALDIQNGKRIELSVKKGTKNELRDGGAAQKGCIVCKGHLELKGNGELDVYGTASHGIYAKEYVEIKNCTVRVLSSKKDGINCSQYFFMESGNLTLSGIGEDGVQASFKDEADRNAEDTGSITISGGTIDMVIAGTAAKGLKADGNIGVNGGEISIVSLVRGVWQRCKKKTKASEGRWAE